MKAYRAIATAALLWVGVCMPSGADAQGSISAKPSATSSATATMASTVPSGVAANVAVASFLAQLPSKFLAGASECVPLKAAVDYEMCMMKKAGNLIKTFYTSELPAFVAAANKTLPPELSNAAVAVLEQVELDYQTCEAAAKQPGAYPETFSNCMSRRLELALETISPKSDPFAYSILSLVTDWWYAIRSCSSTSVKERSACTKKIVKNLSKQVETNVYSTFFPNLLQGDMSEEDLASIGGALQTIAVFPVHLMTNLTDAGCFNQPPVIYGLCVTENSIKAFNNLLMHDLPALELSKDTYYRYTGLLRRIVEGLALCENITTRAEFTVCYEASFLPIRQYAANNELQTRLLHIFEDRWAKPIGQCAAGPMDEQYKCTVDVVLALQSDFAITAAEYIHSPVPITFSAVPSSPPGASKPTSAPAPAPTTTQPASPRPSSGAKAPPSTIWPRPQTTAV